MTLKYILFAGKYKIEKGTPVAINVWALHNDPEAWDNVDQFIPERYLDDNGKMGPKPKNWLPFSAGKRVCLGEFVAKPELHLLFAGLLQRYTWEPEPGTELDVKPIMTFFASKPTEHKLIARKR